MIYLSSEESSTYHDDVLWQAYVEAIGTVMQHQRELAPKKKVLNETQLLAVENYLLSNLTWVDPLDIRNCNIRAILPHQKKRFSEVTGFDTRQVDHLTRCLCYLGDSCAKRQTPLPLSVAWSKMKETGLSPRENCISTYMYVLGLDDGLQDDCAEVATYHDSLFEPNEKTVYLRIRSLIANGDAVAAEKILSSLPDKEGRSSVWKRLRTFVPILTYHCQTGNMSSALHLFRQMRHSDGVLLDDDTYVLLLRALARRGYFFGDSKPIDVAADSGFSTHGPALFDEICAAMAEDLLEISQGNAVSLYESLLDGLENESVTVGSLTDSAVPAFKSVDDRLLVGRVSVDNTTAICRETEVKLRLFSLTESQRADVHDTLLDMAAAQHEAHSGKMAMSGVNSQQGPDCEYAVSALSNFSHWLSHRDGEPFTAIVDGPNVAYHGHGDVHYSQVQKVVDELERIGERPLVVMPQKYVASSFWLSSLRFKQTLAPTDMEIMNGLLEKGMMYTVPKACLDDYYWMLASVANQTSTSGLFVPADGDNGRFPGLRPMLITNDLMRDHRLQLLAARPFRRWTSCHIVNYVIEPYKESEWEDREIQFFPADSFSREIQGNRGGRYPDRTVWHFPVTEWSDEDRLCVCIQS